MRTILVVQGKGGGPKTASVRNLAVAAAVAGRRVGTLDTDPQGTADPLARPAPGRRRPDPPRTAPAGRGDGAADSERPRPAGDRHPDRGGEFPPGDRPAVRLRRSGAGARPPRPGGSGQHAGHAALPARPAPADASLLPRRWVVERTIAWLNRNRHLARDFEATLESALAWLMIASVELLSRRLARTSATQPMWSRTLRRPSKPRSCVSKLSTRPGGRWVLVRAPNIWSRWHARIASRAIEWRISK